METEREYSVDDLIEERGGYFYYYPEREGDLQTVLNNGYKMTGNIGQDIFTGETMI